MNKDANNIAANIPNLIVMVFLLSAFLCLRAFGRTSGGPGNSIIAAFSFNCCGVKGDGADAGRGSNGGGASRLSITRFAMALYDALLDSLTLVMAGDG